FLHAICYGLIFDSIGRAVSLTLSTYGKLNSELVENLFQEKLIERIEYRTYQLVKTIVSRKFK
ncbi:MAG: hypothetical protein HQL46_10265, partial [Gammaproteobacteria bacterium]|nr:hypothetical protein [Gammaproteobacteria bacterium]